MVRSHAPLRRQRGNVVNADLARRYIDGAVDKNGGVALREIESEIRGPLLPDDHADLRLRSELPFSPLCQPRADTIIAPQRVAAGDDQAAGARRKHVSSLARVTLQMEFGG